MSKISVGTFVIINDSKDEKGEKVVGQIIAREVVDTGEKHPDTGHNMCKVSYMVKPVNAVSFKDFKILDKNQISLFDKKLSTLREKVKSYKMSDGSMLTLFAAADRYKYYDADSVNIHTGNWFSIGWSLCSVNDQFNEKIGMKIARRRAYKHPFCKLDSPFSAEFNEDTMCAIMDAKAKYVNEHLTSFNQPGCGYRKPKLGDIIDMLDDFED